MAQQQLSLISPTTAGHQISNSMMQISTGLGAENALSHVNTTDVQQNQHDQRDFSDTSSNGDHAMEDFGMTYYDETSLDGSNPEGGNHSAIRNSAIGNLGEHTTPGVPCEETRDMEHSTGQVAPGTRDLGFDAVEGVSSQNAIPLDQDEYGDDNSSSTSRSTSTTSNASLVGSLIHISPDAPIDNPARSGADASLDDLNIISNNYEATALLRSLEDQGALAAILQKLGYQKSKDAEIKARPSNAAQSDVSKSAHMCSEDGCGKGFARACELK